MQGGGPRRSPAPGDNASSQHGLELVLGRLLLGPEQGPGAAAHRSDVVGINVVFHPMGRGEFGVARGVDSVNVGEFSEKAGQLGLNADVIDVGVVGRVGVNRLDDEAGASLRL